MTGSLNSDVNRSGRTKVEKVYIMWGILLLLFAVVVIVMNIREEKTVRPNETATDPMFRRSRPAKGGRPSSTP
jgi:hypothetical protein